MLFSSQRTGVSAALRDRNLTTNYRVQEVKEKWFDIRLERNNNGMQTKNIHHRRRLQNTKQ